MNNSENNFHVSTVYQALCECRKWCGLSSGHFLPSTPHSSLFLPVVAETYAHSVSFPLVESG